MQVIVPFIQIIGKSCLLNHKEFNEKYSKKAIDLKKTTETNTKWFCDTFNTLDSNYNFLNDIMFSSLVEDAKKEVWAFAKQFGIDETKKLNCSEGWINVAEPKDYQECHLHPMNHFSAVYYVKVPEYSGSIIFKSHSSINDMYNLPLTTGARASFDTYGIFPEECDLIIFRSNILHMVEKNRSDDYRISISMNFKLE